MPGLDYSFPQKILTIVLAILLLPTIVVGQRRVAEENEVFKAVRDGVFTVFGDRGQGSGFIIDDNGLVLTNSHVVSSSRYITVQLDETTRVRATLLAEDKIKDCAVLLIAPKISRSKPILKLANRPVDSLAFEGEKVIAIGSPLHQKRILTSGIVSKVEEGAIITDVNINPGNSGGPLINMDAEVIAINTFRDPSLGGAGISGSIPINAAEDILSTARRNLTNTSLPTSELLPVPPKNPYPVECLRWGRKRCYDSLKYDIPGVNNFEITIYTPPRENFLATKVEERLGAKRRQREKQAGVEESKMYDPLGQHMQEWRQYVGDYAPLVLFRVNPKIDQTGSSRTLNCLGAGLAGAVGAPYYGQYAFEFKGDLQDVELRHGEELVHEVFRTLYMMPVSEKIWNVSFDDIAQQGVFAFLSDPFRDFEVNKLHLVIQDLKKPGKPININIPRVCLEQIWVDFEPYRDAVVARQKCLLIK